MPWKVRPLGSPLVIDNLTINQVAEGLMEDKWETSDHVMGPDDKQFVPIDSHPDLAEIALEVEAAKVEKEEPDPEEQRIDMNPLIDVCLVLLVFFILATTLTVLEKVLDIPQSRSAGALPFETRTREEVQQTSIYLKAFKKDGKPTIEINEQVVSEANLQNHLDNLRRTTRRSTLVIDAKDVEWETVVAVIDAASGAGMRRVQFVVTPR